ncbi:MAG: PAS domain S-box protein [Ferruginibacter sp.]|nr:PAS domain S-box protein [Chitinophagaceae bacterium]
MRKNIPLYIIFFVLLGGVLLFLYTAFRELSTNSELTSRNNIVHSNFQTLSRQINNAAVLHPELNKVNSSIKTRKLFFTDSVAILLQLEMLKSTVREPVNTKIVQKLDTLIRSELSWILRSNVPDSIIHHQSPGHIAAFQSIDSLLNQGIQRTMFLIEYRKTQLNKKISGIRKWMIFFIILSGILLVYTTFNLYREQSRTQSKEKELEIVLNRINDGVVSVDNDWHYTFLNDAALATHPPGKAETLGKVIWDVHPEMKGTIFWDKYHEAMATGKVVEIEDYYAPMDTWFLVKVYPAADGLTIFYTDITKSKKAERKLSQTLKELMDYKFALDESSIVGITDQEGIIKHANHNFCQISKYTADELIGQDHRTINSGYHPKEFIKNLWTTIANGKIWRGELKNKAKDGTIYWVDATIVPFLDDKGNPSQYVAIQADITERKQAEDDLASSEMHFRSLIENSTEGITLTDQFSNVIYRSSGSEKIMGILPTDNAIMLAHPEDLETIKNKFAELLNNPGIPIDFQGRFFHASGNYIWLEGTFTNLLHKKGVNAIVTNYRDITRRKEAEEKLIKSEKIYKTIASSIPGSVICLLDADYRYLLIEGDMLEKLGYSKDKLLGSKAEDVLPQEIFKGVEKQFKKVLKGEVVTSESSSHGYDIISRYIPLKDEDNIVYAIMTVAIDVTELKNAQRDISELNRGLEEKIIERTGQLKKSNDDLEAFSYSVSHDLRAPLRGAIAFATILDEEYGYKLDDEAKRIISIIRDSALKMGKLIDDLLAFSRMGKQGITKSLIDTKTMVNEIVAELALQNKGYDRIRWDIRALSPVHADVKMIRQVWINLLSNAIKYSGTREQPLIEIGSYPGEDMAVFYVKDNGVGFDEEYKDKLFKVFQRLHDADKFEGTGVGLALVEKIVSRHDGKVWAEGKENKGACFYFSLPV